MKVMMLLVCATLCSALVPPIDMCDRCIHQFVDRHGCQAWRESVETGHHMHHEDYMDTSCARFIDSIKDTPQDDDCGARAKTACNLPSDYGDSPHDSDGHGRDGSGNNVMHSHADGDRIYNHNHDNYGHGTNVDPVTGLHSHDVIGPNPSYEHHHFCDMKIFDTPVCRDLDKTSPIGPSSRVCQCYNEVANHHDHDGGCMVWDPDAALDEMGRIVPIKPFGEINYIVCLACMDHVGSFMINRPENGEPVEVSCNGAMEDDNNKNGVEDGTIDEGDGNIEHGDIDCQNTDYASRCPLSCDWCEVDKYVLGCPDVSAMNYMPDATQDDGSCLYSMSSDDDDN